MRSILSGVFLVVLTVLNAPAGVLYSFSQTPYNPPGSYPSPSISFEFTVPTFLTSPTLIPGSSNPPVVPATGLNYSIIPDSIINSPVIHYMGLDLSIMSVSIEPGLNGTTPMIGISMGWGNQVVMSEGVCFDSIPSCYSSFRPTGSQVFDHFGTYTYGDVQLTISPTDVPQTATPEPRFEAAAGMLALLMVIGVARRTRRIVEDRATC